MLAVSVTSWPSRRSGSGVDLMMDSPSRVDDAQIEEAHLSIVEDEE